MMHVASEARGRMNLEREMEVSENAARPTAEQVRLDLHLPTPVSCARGSSASSIRPSLTALTADFRPAHSRIAIAKYGTQIQRGLDHEDLGRLVHAFSAGHLLRGASDAASLILGGHL